MLSYEKHSAGRYFGLEEIRAERRVFSLHQSLRFTELSELSLAELEEGPGAQSTSLSIGTQPSA